MQGQVDPEAVAESEGVRGVAGWQSRALVLLAALWWGSLTTLGFIVVPLLFKHLPTAQLAGQTAARLFTAQSWLSLACGLLLMLASRGRESAARVDWGQGALVFIAAGLLLAMLSEYAVAPRIVARENLAVWHALGSGIYLMQWVCAGVTLWKLSYPFALTHPTSRSTGPS